MASFFVAIGTALVLILFLQLGVTADQDACYYQPCPSHARCILVRNTPSGRRCECNDGYRMFEFKCYAVNTTCSVPPVLNGHTTPGSGSVAVGQMVTFTCDKYFGVVPLGRSTIECKPNGRFSHTIPRCLSEICRFPGIANSPTPATGVYPHHSVPVQCYPNATLVGASNLKCQYDGSFNFPFPRCDLITCRVPPVAHGQTTPRSGVVYLGQSVSVTCGYHFKATPTQHATVLCSKDKTFSHPIARCVPRPCHVPLVVPNGQTTPQGVYQREFGQSFSVTCNPTYTLVGHATLQCGYNRTFSHPIPRCVLPKCNVPQVINGTTTPTTGSVPHGHHVSFQCKPGSRLVGHSMLQCKPDGTFNHPSPKCVLITCTVPRVVFGQTTPPSGSVQYGQTVSVKCIQGLRYTLVPPNSILQCRQDGTLSPAIPQCVAAPCYLPPVANGSPASGLIIPFGKTPKITCNPGYTLSGQLPHCSTDRTFSNPVPQCVDLASLTIPHGYRYQVRLPKHLSQYIYVVRGHSSRGGSMLGDFKAARQHCQYPPGKEHFATVKESLRQVIKSIGVTLGIQNVPIWMHQNGVQYIVHGTQNSTTTTVPDPVTSNPMSKAFAVCVH